MLYRAIRSNLPRFSPPHKKLLTIYQFRLCSNLSVFDRESASLHRKFHPNKFIKKVLSATYLGTIVLSFEMKTPSIGISTFCHRMAGGCQIAVSYTHLTLPTTPYV